MHIVSTRWQWKKNKQKEQKKIVDWSTTECQYSMRIKNERQNKIAHRLITNLYVMNIQWWTCASLTIIHTHTHTVQCWKMHEKSRIERRWKNVICVINNWISSLVLLPFVLLPMEWLRYMDAIFHFKFVILCTSFFSARCMHAFSFSFIL